MARLEGGAPEEIRGSDSPEHGKPLKVFNKNTTRQDLCFKKMTGKVEDDMKRERSRHRVSRSGDKRICNGARAMGLRWRAGSGRHGEGLGGWSKHPSEIRGEPAWWGWKGRLDVISRV